MINWGNIDYFIIYPNTFTFLYILLTIALHFYYSKIINAGLLLVFYLTFT